MLWGTLLLSIWVQWEMSTWFFVVKFVWVTSHCHWCWNLKPEIGVNPRFSVKSFYTNKIRTEESIRYRKVVKVQPSQIITTHYPTSEVNLRLCSFSFEKWKESLQTSTLTNPLGLMVYQLMCWESVPQHWLGHYGIFSTYPTLMGFFHHAGDFSSKAISLYLVLIGPLCNRNRNKLSLFELFGALRISLWSPV